jgi:hypothetical protein
MLCLTNYRIISPTSWENLIDKYALLMLGLSCLLRNTNALWRWHLVDAILFFQWCYSQYTMVLYIMNSSQFHSIYLKNLHMSVRKKTECMSQDNISSMLNTSIKTLLLLCKYLNQAAGNLLRQIYKPWGWTWLCIDCFVLEMLTPNMRASVMHTLLVSSKSVIPILLECIQVGVEVDLSYHF